MCGFNPSLILRLLSRTTTISDSELGWGDIRSDCKGNEGSLPDVVTQWSRHRASNRFSLNPTCARYKAAPSWCSLECHYGCDSCDGRIHHEDFLYCRACQKRAHRVISGHNAGRPEQNPPFCNSDKLAGGGHTTK